MVGGKRIGGKRVVGIRAGVERATTASARCGACRQRLRRRGVACERCHTSYHRRCAREGDTCGPRPCPTQRPSTPERFRLPERRRRELRAEVRQEEDRRLRRQASLLWDEVEHAAYGPGRRSGCLADLVSLAIFASWWLVYACAGRLGDPSECWIALVMVLFAAVLLRCQLQA